MKLFGLTAGALMLSATAASAAMVTNDLNLRRGPGTGYGVIDTMPAGAHVNIIRCRGSWCRVDWRGEVGYASSGYLSGGPVYAAAPPVYVAPPPVVSFGIGFGGGHRWHHRGGRHHRHHH